MKTKNKFYAISLVALGVSFFGASSSKADSYQACKPGQGCSFGEFLFDNAYNPVVTDVCVVDVIDPSGNTAVNSMHTSFGSADGWHGYSVTVSQPEGLYRSVMCCTVGQEKTCKDKSFLLQADGTQSSSGGLTSEDLNNVKSDIVAKIDSSASGVNSNVIDAKNNISNKVDSSTGNINANVTDAKVGINANISDTKTSLSEKIDSSTSYLKEKIGKVGDSVSGLWSKIKKLFSRK